MRVSRDAVAADRDAWLMDVAERLAVARLDDLVDVDLVVVGVTGRLVANPMLMFRGTWSLPIWQAQPLRLFPEPHTPLGHAIVARRSNCKRDFGEPRCQLGVPGRPADRFG